MDVIKIILLINVFNVNKIMNALIFKIYVYNVFNKNI